jgi:hypothetical protein
MAFCWGLLIVAVIPIVAGISFFNSWEITAVPFCLLFSWVFWAAGYYLYISLSKPRVFDRAAWYFYKWKPTNEVWMIDINDKKLTSLNDIYAIQLLSESCSWSESSYCSYEINLVLKDKSRVNVMDHGDLNVIRNDAKTIWNFLWVPVWVHTMQY